MKKIEEYVRSIPDFPEPGIIFRDVTSILQDAQGLRLAIDLMQEKLKDVDFDVVAGTESRGFIFGVPIAYNMEKSFVPVNRKFMCCGNKKSAVAGKSVLSAAFFCCGLPLMTGVVVFLVAVMNYNKMQRFFTIR